MVERASWLSGRILALIVATLAFAMAVRAVVPAGYMPAQAGWQAGLTFCYVGLNHQQQVRLGLPDTTQDPEHQNTLHCLLAAQGQTHRSKLLSGLFVAFGLLAYLLLRPWPESVPSGQVLRYPFLWARAPPV